MTDALCDNEVKRIMDWVNAYNMHCMHCIIDCVNVYDMHCIDSMHVIAFIE